MAAGDLLTAAAPNGVLDPEVYQDVDGNWYMLYGEMASGGGIDLRIATLSGTPAPAPDPTPTAPGPPTITPDVAAMTVAGAQVWLFVVDDGMPNPAVSSEADGRVQLGRIRIDRVTE